LYNLPGFVKFYRHNAKFFGFKIISFLSYFIYSFKKSHTGR
jgi:hypothetical protein